MTTVDKPYLAARIDRELRRIGAGGAAGIECHYEGSSRAIRLYDTQETFELVDALTYLDRLRALPDDCPDAFEVAWQQSDGLTK